MRLVRAIKKAPEDMPEWTRCCVEAFEARCQQIAPIVVDLDRTIKDGGSFCAACRADLPPSVGVMDTADKKFYPLDMLELDEGPA